MRACLVCLSELACRLLGLTAKAGTRYLVKQQTNAGSACTGTCVGETWWCFWREEGSCTRGDTVRRLEKRESWGSAPRPHTVSRNSKDTVRRTASKSFSCAATRLAFAAASLPNQRNLEMTIHKVSADSQSQHCCSSNGMQEGRSSTESHTKNMMPSTRFTRILQSEIR